MIDVYVGRGGARVCVLCVRARVGDYVGGRVGGWVTVCVWVIMWVVVWVGG